MRKISVSVYKFDELSDAAKQVAIERYRVKSYQFDDPFEDFDEGMDYSERGFTEIKTRISLYCQGSGVSFDSEVDLAKFVPDRVKNNPSLLRLLKSYVTVKTKMNDSNAYSFPAESDVEMSDEIEYFRKLPRIWDFLETMLHNIRQEYMKLCKELEKQAYAQDEWFFGDEKIAEDIEVNEYDFTADGKRFEYDHLTEEEEEGVDEECISCNCCEPMMINGVFCHETGCPNMRKVWVDGEWVEREVETEDEYYSDGNED